MNYLFTLKYQLVNAEQDMLALVERLGACGCDDALVGTGLPGRLALEFTREAAGAEAAVRSAIDDVQRAAPDALLIEAGPDLVGLTDIAERVGVSRQAMRKLMLSNAGRFPAPVHEGTTSIWHLVDVLRWLRDTRGYSIADVEIDVAQAALQVNLAKECRRLQANQADCPDASGV